MLITAYPNSEIVARIPPVALKKRSGGDSGVSARGVASILSIAENLRLNFSEAVKRPPEVRVGPAPGYGTQPKGVKFGLRAKRLIRRSAGVFGVGGYQNWNLFLTGTLPGGTEDAFRAIAAHSSWIVHTLLTRIPRLIEVPARDLMYQWVWEWQKRGALHWHCVIKLPGWKERDVLLSGFTDLWNSALRGLSERSGVDVFERAEGGTWKDNPETWRSRAEVLRKNPANYMSKYMSKSESKDGKGFFSPTRWYGLSRNLHRQLRKDTIRVSTHESNSTRHEISDVDLGILKELAERSSSHFYFADKFGSGRNFVFYPKEQEVQAVKDMIGKISGSARKLSEGRNATPRRKEFHGLHGVANSAYLRERFLEDIGEDGQQVYWRWTECDIPDSDPDLQVLNAYALGLATLMGVTIRSQPPKRSGAGLTGPSLTKLEEVPPPLEGPEYDQPSLFP